MENKPHRILISAEMKKAVTIEQNIVLEGCRGFLETALFNIFFTIYERDSDLFFKAMDKLMEELLKD